MSDADQRKKGFTIGYLAGLCGMPLAIAPALDVSGMWSYNGVVLPSYEDATDKYHRLAIMKHETEDAYILFDIMIGWFYVDESSDEVLFSTDTITTTSVYICPAGGNAWKPVPTLDYAEERETEYFSGLCYYVGRFENFIWTEEDAEGLSSGIVMKYGTDPVVLYNADNKAIMIGCRLGYIVRSQMGKGNVEIPSGVLISSDGYILTDCNGVYLIAFADAEPDEPGEVATMYLYGTPSESGNIGLRVGDTVTYYSGVVLPALPEWDKTVYPYAVIVEYKATILNKENRAFLYLLKDQSDRYLQEGSIDTEDIYYHAGDMYYKATSATDEPYTEWTESGILSEDERLSLENIKWTNEPIYYQYDNHYGASGDLALAASEPIPVSGIVDTINGIPIYEQKEDS